MATEAMRYAQWVAYVSTLVRERLEGCSAAERQAFYGGFKRYLEMNMKTEHLKVVFGPYYAEYNRWVCEREGLPGVGPSAERGSP